MSFRSACLPLLIINLLLIRNVCTGGTDGINNSLAQSCACPRFCDQDLVSAPQASSQAVYFHDEEAGSCIELASSCVTDPSCKFASRSDCVAHCGAADDAEKAGEGEEEGDGVEQGDCEGTQAGCCPDGTPRSRDGKCSDSVDQANAASPPNSSTTALIRWDLITMGIGVLVLLVVVLSVSGVVAYRYKEKQRERMRSRYIHNVLEMYESEDTESELSDGPGVSGGGAQQAGGSFHDKGHFVKA